MKILPARKFGRRACASSAWGKLRKEGTKEGHLRRGLSVIRIPRFYREIILSRLSFCHERALRVHISGIRERILRLPAPPTPPPLRRPASLSSLRGNPRISVMVLLFRVYKERLSLASRRVPECSIRRNPQLPSIWRFGLTPSAGLGCFV
jgi:hypothetical protein